MQRPPIEDIVPYLDDVGSPLLSGVECVKRKVAAVKAAEAVVVALKREAERRRLSLMKRVRQSYVDAEIETAEVMFNRRGSAAVTDKYK